MILTIIPFKYIHINFKESNFGGKCNQIESLINKPDQDNYLDFKICHYQHPLEQIQGILIK